MQVEVLNECFACSCNPLVSLTMKISFKILYRTEAGEALGVMLDGMSAPFSEFADEMKKAGESQGVDIHVMHEDIFNAMHRI